MKAMFAVAVAGLMVVSNAQQSCQYYRWTESDFPADNKDFASILGNQYLNGSDFALGGNFSGQSWEDVFWSRVNQSAKPPTSYYRPLGFRYAKLGAYNDPTICLSATGVQGYKVELMVYTLTPQASLCMQDMSADNYNPQDGGAVSACDSQYIYNCFDADTDTTTLNVSIYCDTNCEDGSNVHVLWRFRRSSLTWDESREFTSENPEMWCNMIASDIVWPDEIEEAVPEEYEAIDNISSGSMVFGSFAYLLIAGILSLFH